MNSLSAPARRWQRPVVLLFFAALLLLGLALFRDYGLSVDENQSRHNGMVSLRYVSELFWPGFVKRDSAAFEYYRNFPLQTYYDRDYGVAFELPVTFVERTLRIWELRKIFWFRHLCTYLACLAGVWAVYRMGTRRYHDWRIGLLVALAMVLSPRLFAEFFYNDKDAVFMAAVAVAMNSGVAFIQRPNWARAWWHALACAICIDVRIMGVLVPAATLGIWGLRALRGDYGGWRRLAPVALYAVLLPTLVVAFWPYLWEAPLNNFVEGFRKMSHFRWEGKVLYMGEMVQAIYLPWHYAPVWIGLTTPILYVGSFLVGGGVIAWQVLRRRFRLFETEGEWQDLFFIGLALAPVAAVILLHSVLYDGWRQLYFVYPGFLLVALRGWMALWRWRPSAAGLARRWPQLLAVLLVVSFAASAVQIVRLHPLQNVYFNALAPRPVDKQFEVDYWSLSYRPALEWIASHDNRMDIRVSANMTGSAEINRWMLGAYARERIHIVEEAEGADYYISTYRWHPEDYPHRNEVYRLEKDGMRVISVFRL